MTVKAPTGMQEELARPVIEVVEFPSGKITHEMFAFGSEIAVVPVTSASRGQLSPMRALAKEQIVQTIQQWVGVQCEVQFTSETSAKVYAPQNMISTLVGRGGENVNQLQDELGGMKLSIESFEDMPEGLGEKKKFWENSQDRHSRENRNREGNRKGSGKSDRRKSRKNR